MEQVKILEIASAIAGVGGLALAVFLILCREIIRKNIFPNLTRDQAYRVILLIIILAFGTAMAGLAAWLYARQQDKTPAPTAPISIVIPPLELPKITSLSWKKNSTKDGELALVIENGPAYNIEVEATHNFAVIFVPTKKGTGKGFRSLFRNETGPLYKEQSGTDTKFKLTFASTMSDLRIVSEKLFALVDSNSGSFGAVRYDFFVRARYQNEVGASLERAWGIKLFLQDAEDIKSLHFNPTAASTVDFREATELEDRILKCNRATDSPTAALEGAGESFQLSRLITTPPLCPKT